MKKRILSILLTIAMCINLLPAMAVEAAAQNPCTHTEVDETGYCNSCGEQKVACYQWGDDPTLYNVNGIGMWRAFESGKKPVQIKVLASTKINVTSNYTVTSQCTIDLDGHTLEMEKASNNNSDFFYINTTEDFKITGGTIHAFNRGAINISEYIDAASIIIEDATIKATGTSTNVLYANNAATVTLGQGSVLEVNSASASTNYAGVIYVPKNAEGTIWLLADGGKLVNENDKGDLIYNQSKETTFNIIINQPGAFNSGSKRVVNANVYFNVSDSDIVLKDSIAWYPIAQTALNVPGASIAFAEEHVSIVNDQTYLKEGEIYFTLIPEKDFAVTGLPVVKDGAGNAYTVTKVSEEDYGTVDQPLTFSYTQTAPTSTESSYAIASIEVPVQHQPNSITKVTESAFTKVYDGNAFEVSTSDFVTVSGETVNILGYYTKETCPEEDKLEGAPVNVGSYWVQIECPKTEGYLRAVETYPMTIEKATAQIEGGLCTYLNGEEKDTFEYYNHITVKMNTPKPAESQVVLYLDQDGAETQITEAQTVVPGQELIFELDTVALQLTPEEDGSGKAYTLRAKYIGNSNVDGVSVEKQIWIQPCSHAAITEGVCKNCQEAISAGLQIGEEFTYCATLSQAFEQAAASDQKAVVTLMTDIGSEKNPTTETYALNSGTVEFDLNGKKLYGAYEKAALNVGGSANLTITDSSNGAGMISGGTTVAVDGGTLTVKSGSLTGTQYAVAANASDARVNIEGGTISGAEKTFKVTGDQNICIIGGTFSKGVSAEKDGAVYPIKNLLRENYDLQKADGTWVYVSADTIQISEKVTVHEVISVKAHPVEVRGEYGTILEIAFEVREPESMTADEQITYTWYKEGSNVPATEEYGINAGELSDGGSMLQFANWAGVNKTGNYYCVAEYNGYVLESNMVSVSIEPRVLDIQWENVENRYPYDGKRAAATVTNILEGDKVTVDFESNELDEAGFYKAEVTGLSGEDAANYTLIGADTKREFTVTASVSTLVVGHPISDESFVWEKSEAGDTWQLTLRGGEYGPVKIDRNEDTDSKIEIITTGDSMINSEQKDESDPYARNVAVEITDTKSEYTYPCDMIFSGTSTLTINGTVYVGAANGDRLTIDENANVVIYVSENEMPLQLGGSGAVDGTLIVNGTLTADRSESTDGNVIVVGNVAIGEKGDLKILGGLNGLVLNGTSYYYREDITWENCPWERSFVIADGGKFSSTGATEVPILVLAGGVEEGSESYKNAFVLPEGYLQEEQAEVKLAYHAEAWQTYISLIRTDGEFKLTLIDETAEYPEYQLVCTNPVKSLPYVAYQMNLSSKTENYSGETLAVNLVGDGVVEAGTSHTVKAPIVEGYEFLGWYNKNEYELSGEAAAAVCKNLEYTFTVSKDEDLIAVYQENEMVTLTITGPTCFHINDSFVGTDPNYQEEFRVGTEIKLKAVQTEGYRKFFYWMNESSKIVSTSLEYTFIITDDVQLTILYQIQNEVMVEYVSDYDQVLLTGSYQSDSEIVPPTAPSKIGYEFVEWSMTVDEIKQAIQDGETYIKVTPVYEKKQQTYTVTVHYDKDDSLTTVYTNQADGSTMTAAAKQISGKVFSHWSSDAEGTIILGTGEKYFFTITSDVELYAVYTNAEEKAEPKPAINVVDQYTVTENAVNKVVFVVNRSVPNGYTVVKTGGLYGTREAFGSTDAENQMVLGGTGVKEMAASSKTLNGVYVMNIRVGSSVDTIVYARGYVTIRNNATGNLETIYSPIQSGSYNSLKK